MGTISSQQLHPEIQNLVLTSEQVKHLRERFELISDSFSLNREEVQTLFKAKPEQLELIFQLFDASGREKVDAYEFIAGMIIISDASLLRKADILFELYDFDHSQNITFDELVIMLRTGMNALCCMARAEPISTEELESHTQRVFAKVDTNHDNSISLYEWRSFITRDTEVMRILASMKITTSEDRRRNFGTADDPEADSDLENETTNRHWERSEFYERVKDGVEVLEENPEDTHARSWETTARQATPSNYRSRPGEDDPPDAALELEFVHGYRCHDTRNNLRYTPSGKIIYHAAAVGIVHDIEDNTQQHFLTHSDDIISFDSSEHLAVTGEIGRAPLVCVWNTQTLEVVKAFKGFLTKGAALVCISPDARKVAALGADSEHALVVYDLTSSADKPLDAVCATGKLGRGSFFDMRFDPATGNLLVCGNKKFLQLTLDEGRLSAQRGSGWGSNAETQPQALLCIGFVSGKVVTGAHNGCLFLWENGVLSQAVRMHRAAVVCMSQRPDGGLITGGNDGFVHLLDASLSRVRSIDLRQLGSLVPRPRACCEGPGNRLLLGTRGGEIYEVAGQSSRTLVKGHFDKDLTAISVHPTRGEFATAGEDTLLSVWDVPGRRQKAFVKLEAPGTALDYSSEGSLLAAGLISGKLVLLDANSLSIVDTKHDRIPAITTIRFEGVLAVGGVDSEIFVYDSSSFALKFKLRGQNAPILHIDITGSVLRANSKDADLSFYDLDSGKHVPNGSTVYKDEAWLGVSCVYSWSTQGIWPSCSNGADINAVSCSRSRRVLGAVDDYGQVKLFKYPSAKKNAAYNAYRGHSARVMGCGFVEDRMVTIGGEDKCVFQWRYTEEAGDFVADEEALEAVRGEVELSRVDRAPAEFLAVKPWLGELQASAPVDYKPPKRHSKPPEQNLRLLKVHGYRAFDSRNNLRYTASGKIVYPAAALGIVMDPVTRNQQFFSMHDEDVVCLAIHPNRRIVATGQMAKIGKTRSLELHVWDCETLESLACLKGFHRRAIRHVGFSPGGSKLLSVGEDDDHSMAVYNWRSQLLLCSTKVDKDAVLSANFIDESSIAVHGAKFIKFFTLQGKNIKGVRGKSGGRSVEAQICGTTFNGVYITGTHTGKLMQWSGSTMVNSTKAHTGQVSVVITFKEYLLSGGSEGAIHMWDSGIRQMQTVDLVASSLAAGIRSIDVKEDETILVGTKGAEIMEVRGFREIEILGTGHFAGELWGLAMHPFHPLCATCGGDKTIRIWDLVQGTMLLAIKPLAHDMRAIDWSTDGRLLVSGLVNGAVILLDSSSLTTLSSIQSSFKGKDCWIEDIKFSPDDSKVAFGAHGGASKVEIAGVQNGKLVKMYTINAGLTSALTHLDWSVDNSLVVVNSQAYELKFVSVEGKRNVASSSTKGTEWQSWTCVLGWPVQYIWPEFADGTDINATMRSHNRQLLATADDFGSVNLYRWPVCVKKQGCKSYSGHSSHVTKVRFSYDDAFAVSTGGNDKCVFVWETDLVAPESEAPPSAKAEVEETPPAPRRHQEGREKTKARLRAAIEGDDPSLFFHYEDSTEGQQAMGSKPWEGALRPPADFLKPSRNGHRAPAAHLELDFVHGYRAKDCRNNLHYLGERRIIYHAAGLGVIFDKMAHAQMFFDKHVDDITAFALSTSGVLAATGEVGRYPSIYVWDTRSLMHVAQFKGTLEKGIACLAISPSERKVAAVAADDDHWIAVFDIYSGALLASLKGDRQKILAIAYTGESEFVTAGVKHFKMWTLSGSRLTAKRGQFGKQNANLLCLCTNGGTAYTGTAGGAVLRWQGAAVSKNFSVHERAVDSIWCSAEWVVTGGKDGYVHIMDHSFRKTQSFDLKNPAYDCASYLIRSAQLSPSGSTVLIGTYGSEIFELDLRTGQGNCFLRGHYTPNRGRTVTNEVWGLAMMPDNQHFLTSSDDGTMRLWNIQQREQVRVIKFAEGEEIHDSSKARCIAVSPDSAFVAVGFKDGNFKILETAHWTVSLKKKDRKEEISDLKFAPDGSALAVGSHDNFIDVYAVPNFNQIAVCRGHSSYITHIDWSEDSQSLHSNCGAYELLFWEGRTGRQLTSGASMLKNEPWNTWTCVIGWPVQGIYPPYADGTDVNATDRSKHWFGNREYPLIATADDFGLVKVFRYPCLAKGAEALIGRGHSSHVTNVRFSNDSQWLFSTGGDDQCVFQWKITNKFR